MLNILAQVVTLPLAFGCPGGFCPTPAAPIVVTQVYQHTVYQPVAVVRAPVYRVVQPRRFRPFRRCR